MIEQIPTDRVVEGIGTNIVTGILYTKKEYHKENGYTSPEGEEAYDLGYKITYNKSNYTHWLPYEEFHKIYNTTKINLSFSEALKAIKLGKRAYRAGWNSKGMFIFLVQGSRFKVNRPPLLGIYPEGTEINYHAHIDMRTADGYIVPWLANQTDLLANDWCITELSINKGDK